MTAERPIELRTCTLCNIAFPVSDNNPWSIHTRGYKHSALRAEKALLARGYVRITAAGDVRPTNQVRNLEQIFRAAGLHPRIRQTKPSSVHGDNNHAHGQEWWPAWAEVASRAWDENQAPDRAAAARVLRALAHDPERRAAMMALRGTIPDAIEAHDALTVMMRLYLVELFNRSRKAP